MENSKIYSSNLRGSISRSWPDRERCRPMLSRMPSGRLFLRRSPWVCCVPGELSKLITLPKISSGIRNQSLESGLEMSLFESVMSCIAKSRQQFLLLLSRMMETCGFASSQPNLLHEAGARAGCSGSALEDSGLKPLLALFDKPNSPDELPEDTTILRIFVLFLFP